MNKILAKTIALIYLLIINVIVSDAKIGITNFQEPSFEEFKEENIFQGKPVVPKINNNRARNFRNVIREQAQKGVNFAGHYIIATWGCGASCFSFAILDAKTGFIYFPDFNVVSVPLKVQEPLLYKTDSRLLILDGCPNEINCGKYFYKWNNNKLVLIKSIKSSR